MSEYNFDLEMPAKVTALQPTDVLIVGEASSGVKKSITGNLLIAGASGVVASTSTNLALTVTQHAGRVVVLSTNSSGTSTWTLPAATGSGARFTIYNGIAQTQGSIVITRAGSDAIKGRNLSFDSTAVATHQNVFVTLTATAITWNRTTTGGGLGQDSAEFFDEAAAVWRVTVVTDCSGSNATCFS